MAVLFDSVLFNTRFPEFTALEPALQALHFEEACLKLDNSDCSVVQDESERRILLYLLTAHFAQLGAQAAQGNGNMVGRISSVSQGSVSVSADAGPVSNNNAWYLQTAYGAKYWALTAKYRSMRYVPASFLI